MRSATHRVTLSSYLLLSEPDAFCLAFEGIQGGVGKYHHRPYGEGLRGSALNEKSVLLQSGNETAVARNDLEVSCCPNLLGCAAQGTSAGEGPPVLVLRDTHGPAVCEGLPCCRRAADLRAFCSSSLSSGAGLQQGSASRLVLCWLLATCRRLPHASIKAPHVMPSLQHSGHEPCRGLVAQLGPVPVCHQVRGKPSPRYGTQVVLHQSKEEQNTAAEEERHESTPFPCSCLLQWALETRKIKCICSRGT